MLAWHASGSIFNLASVIFCSAHFGHKRAKPTTIPQLEEFAYLVEIFLHIVNGPIFYTDFVAFSMLPDSLKGPESKLTYLFIFIYASNCAPLPLEPWLYFCIQLCYMYRFSQSLTHHELTGKTEDINQNKIQNKALWILLWPFKSRTGAMN